MLHADKARYSHQRCFNLLMNKERFGGRWGGGGGADPTSKTGRVACCIRVGALKFMASRCSHNTGANPRPCISRLQGILIPVALYATNTVQGTCLAYNLHAYTICGGSLHNAYCTNHAVLGADTGF